MDSKHLNANSNHSKKDLKNSNANSNHSKGIRSIRMQILTIQKGFEGFEAFKFKFDPFERDSNGNSNHSKGIRMILMQILTI